MRVTLTFFSIMGVLQTTVASRSFFYRAVLALLTWRTPSASVLLTVWLLQYLLIYYTTRYTVSSKFSLYLIL